MAAANLYYNYSDLKLTPGTGTAITVGEIKEVDEMASDPHEQWRASGRRFPSAIGAADASRGLRIRTGDLVNAELIDPAVPYTLTVVRKLNKPNGTTVGKLITLSHAYLDGEHNANNRHNKFGEQTLTFVGLGDDADADPLAYTDSTSLTPP